MGTETLLSSLSFLSVFLSLFFVLAFVMFIAIVQRSAERRKKISVYFKTCDSHMPFRLTTDEVCIDGFHSDVIRLESQKSDVLRNLIYTRLKSNKTKIFV